MSKQAVINYIAKYASKGEPQSQTYSEILKTIISKNEDSSPARKAIQQLLTKSVAERDYSSQEVAHLLMGLPLYHSTRQFVVLTIGKEEWVQISNRPGESSAEGDNVIEVYKKRPRSYESLTLEEFAKNIYRNGKKEMQKDVQRKKSAILQVYPKLRLDTSSTTEQKNAFYRQKLLLSSAWRREEDVMGNHATWEEVADSRGHDAISEDAIEAEHDEFECGDYESDEEFEEFMVAARAGPNNQLMSVELGNRELDVMYHWDKGYNDYTSIEEIPTFLQDAKKDSDDDEEIRHTRPAVTLTCEQEEAMTLLASQIQFIRQPRANISPHKRFIIQGKGGSGKSTLIEYMKAELAEKIVPKCFLLMAPTGSAALNIGGSTIHSTLNIGITGELRDLHGEQLRKFQLFMEPVKFLIFDEYSMIGSRLLGKIDKRCREAHAQNASEPFGGMFVYFLGDIKQLPPVMDGAPYMSSNTRGIATTGRAAYYSIEKCVTLGQSQRQCGADVEQQQFRALLDRLSRGESTLDDWKLICLRSPYLIENFAQEFKDAIRLFLFDIIIYLMNWLNLSTFKNFVILANQLQRSRQRITVPRQSKGQVIQLKVSRRKYTSPKELGSCYEATFGLKKVWSMALWATCTTSSSDLVKIQKIICR